MVGSGHCLLHSQQLAQLCIVVWSGASITIRNHGYRHAMLDKYLSHRCAYFFASILVSTGNVEAVWLFGQSSYIYNKPSIRSRSLGKGHDQSHRNALSRSLWNLQWLKEPSWYLIRSLIPLASITCGNDLLTSFLVKKQAKSEWDWLSNCVRRVS